jgi:hypothetical protein
MHIVGKFKTHLFWMSFDHSCTKRIFARDIVNLIYGKVVFCRTRLHFLSRKIFSRLGVFHQRTCSTTTFQQGNNLDEMSDVDEEAIRAALVGLGIGIAPAAAAAVGQDQAALDAADAGNLDTGNLDAGNLDAGAERSTRQPTSQPTGPPLLQQQPQLVDGPAAPQPPPPAVVPRQAPLLVIDIAQLKQLMEALRPGRAQPAAAAAEAKPGSSAEAAAIWQRIKDHPPTCLPPGVTSYAFASMGKIATLRPPNIKEEPFLVEPADQALRQWAKLEGEFRSHEGETQFLAVRDTMQSIEKMLKYRPRADKERKELIAIWRHQNARVMTLKLIGRGYTDAARKYEGE